MESLLREIIDKNRHFVREGSVADYIPALKKANREDIGISIFDLEGNNYSYEKYNKKFTIQSISKVIALMQALIEVGEDEVFKGVGYEGTVDSFNSLYKLDFPYIEKPANPMINAGAISTTSRILGNNDEKFKKILNLLKHITKNDNLDYDREVYSSEKATGDKNRSIAYLMKTRGIIQGDVEEVLDAYFKQCSILVDTVDLANIGLFLANGAKGLEDYGKIDRTRMTSLIIGIMNNCGMYNFSGRYAVDVGIPSKSGVAGGLLAVVPGSMGIGIYNPALDDNGNPIVGYNIMKDLSKKLNLSLFK